MRKIHIDSQIEGIFHTFSHRCDRRKFSGRQKCRILARFSRLISNVPFLLDTTDGSHLSQLYFEIVGKRWCTIEIGCLISDAPVLLEIKYPSLRRHSCLSKNRHVVNFCRAWNVVLDVITKLSTGGNLEHRSRYNYPHECEFNWKFLDLFFNGR